MRERPIIMTGESVCAILSGAKTQTRRVIKPQPDKSVLMLISRSTHAGNELWGNLLGTGKVLELESRKCPYGKRGDRLYVKETWRKGMTDNGLAVEYKAAPKGLPDRTYLDDYPDKSADWYWLPDMPWKSPLLMPRWASRLTLEIVSVRVERVNEISEADARAEGVAPLKMDGGLYRPRFEGLWDSINAKRGYPVDSGCWVWVIEFYHPRPVGTR